MSDVNQKLLDACKGLSQRSYKRQRTMLYQGEIPNSVYVVKSGVVRAYNIAENGEERTVELLSVGDVLPPSWVFGSSNVNLYYYDAFSDATLYVCSKPEFQEIIKAQHIERELLELIARRYTAATMHINALLQTHAQDKIALGLQYLVLSHGRKLQDGTSKIEIRLTQQDLANLVGVTRETATIELNKLRDKKIITYKSFTYTVNYEALVRISGGDEFAGLSL